MRTLFWMSMGLVIYTYLGYPLVLAVLAKLRPRAIRKKDVFPFVSIVIAARNEADKIRHKIDQTLDLAYPAGRLEILVGSDASDDGTDEIVQEYVGRSVHLVRAPQRSGKEYVQALALAVAKGDVIVFTDAATILESDALTHLARNFADPTIGAVSTEDVILDEAGNPTAEGLYVKYEMGVRRLESRFHSLVGLSGSCFAIRKELCTTWPANLASDFMAALHAARGGYRSVADPLARGRFVAVNSQAELRRKIRTFLRGITVLMANLDLLNPFRYGRFSFQLSSHKLLRCLAPFLLLTALVAGAVLRADPPIGILFWLQAGFYLVAALGGMAPPLQRYRVVRVAHYFAMAQCAMLAAWTKYALGQQQLTWEPSQRQILPRAAVPSSPSRGRTASDTR